MLAPGHRAVKEQKAGAFTQVPESLHLTRMHGGILLTNIHRLLPPPSSSQGSKHLCALNSHRNPLMHVVTYSHFSFKQTETQRDQKQLAMVTRLENAGVET